MISKQYKSLRFEVSALTQKRTVLKTQCTNQNQCRKLVIQLLYQIQCTNKKSGKQNIIHSFQQNDFQNIVHNNFLLERLSHWVIYNSTNVSASIIYNNKVLILSPQLSKSHFVQSEDLSNVHYLQSNLNCSCKDKFCTF